MSDSHYPSVDIDFIEEHMKGSGLLAVDGIVKIGASTTYVMAGTSAIYKRSTLVRELEPGQICLEQAIALGWKFSFLTALLKWLEDNRNWKDGAYIEANNQ